MLGVNQQQHRDILGDQIDVALEAFDLEQLTNLFDQHPGWRRLTRHHVETAIDLQARQHAHHRALRLGQALHQTAEFVLKELFLIEGEERDHLGLAFGIFAGQAEVDRVATLLQRNALQAKLGGFVFILGERRGINDVQLELTARFALVGLEHFFHALGVGAQGWQLLGGRVGVEEVQLHRLIQLSQNLLGAA